MRASIPRGLALFLLLLAPEAWSLQRFPEGCDAHRAAVLADTNDLQAASRLGQCTVRDEQVIAPDGDSTRVVFRSSWGVALRALRRAVNRDPTYTAAYRPLFRMLFAEMRDGCSYATGICAHVAPVLRAGDSVITPPRLVQLNVPGVDTYDEARRETEVTRRASLSEARDLAKRWASLTPNDRRPHEYLGRALLELGDPAAATIELEYAAVLGDDESRRGIFWYRFEALVKTDRGADARRLLDERANQPGPDSIRSFTVAGLNGLLGRNRPPPVDTTRARHFRARVDSLIRSRPPPSRREPSFLEHLAAGDTLAARRVLERLDSSLAEQADMPSYPRISPMHLQSAEYHLALADTAGAEARLAQIEAPIAKPRFQFITLMYMHTAPWLGHAWLLTGDVAAARGRRAEAARMYHRVIGLWGGGDRDLQPVVDRARERLSSLRER